MWSQSSSLRRCEKNTLYTVDDKTKLTPSSPTAEKLNGKNNSKQLDLSVSKSNISLVSCDESFNSSTAYIEKSFNEQENIIENIKDSEKKEKIRRKKCCNVNLTESLKQELSPKVEKNLSNISNKAKLSGPHFRVMEHLRSTKATTFSLRYVIYLTFSFILCTLPTMILLCIDMLSRSLNLNMVLLNSCLMCPFVYCYLCPFILVKCLPGVKNSLSSLILSVYSTSG